MNVWWKYLDNKCVGKQNDGENAETFITAVHKLTEHCNFRALKEELIQDQRVG